MTTQSENVSPIYWCELESETTDCFQEYSQRLPSNEALLIEQKRRFNAILNDKEMATAQFTPDYFLLVE